MEVQKLDADVDTAARRALRVLRDGGVILYPTDTLYGLGADALSDEAVRKVREIKGRTEDKPIHAIFSDIGAAGALAEVNDYARMLASAFLPGPLTLILKKRSGIESGMARGIDTIGIRIPNNAFCLALAREFGRPFTTTSANKSGRKSERSIDAIVRQLGRSAQSIALAIDAGELPQKEPSTVVDLTAARPIILREGAIPSVDVWDVLGLATRE